MTEKAEIMRVLTSSPGDLVRSYFKRREAVAPRVDPRHTDVPTLRGADVAAVHLSGHLSTRGRFRCSTKTLGTNNARK